MRSTFRFLLSEIKLTQLSFVFASGFLLFFCSTYYILVGSWRPHFPVLLVSLLPFCLPPSQIHPFLVILLLPPVGVLHFFVSVTFILVYFLRCEELSPPRLSPSTAMVFGHDIVNLSLTFPPRIPCLLCNSMEAVGPNSVKSFLPRTY